MCFQCWFWNCLCFFTKIIFKEVMIKILMLIVAFVKWKLEFQFPISNLNVTFFKIIFWDSLEMFFHKKLRNIYFGLQSVPMAPSKQMQNTQPTYFWKIYFTLNPMFLKFFCQNFFNNGYNKKIQTVSKSALKNNS